MNPHIPAAMIVAAICAIVLYLAPTSARGDAWVSPNKWTTTDKVLLGSFVALQAIDVAQTKRVLKRGGYEMNPIFGKHPSDGQLLLGKAIGTSAIYWLSDNYPEYRTGILIGAVAVQAVVVRRNYIGAQAGWGF